MDGRSAAQRRDDLRARLQAQRLEIAARLGRAGSQEGGFPRSATLRLLARRPALLARALGIAFNVFRAGHSR